MVENYIPDNLFAGHVMPKVVDSGVIAEGQVLTRGAVLGKDTDGKLKIYDKNATDGSENIYAILAENVDASIEDKVVSIFLTGEFNENVLYVAEGTAITDIKDTARNIGIFIKPVVRA